MMKTDWEGGVSVKETLSRSDFRMPEVIICVCMT